MIHSHIRTIQNDNFPLYRDVCPSLGKSSKCSYTFPEQNGTSVKLVPSTVYDVSFKIINDNNTPKTIVNIFPLKTIIAYPRC